MTDDNSQLAAQQQQGTQEESETSSVEGSQKTSQTLQEKISTAKSRITELELLITHWKNHG
tara:strand:- start:950 stop:1132 length:183 start_codon:yes stop_codon:yes gene_type:complete